MAAAEERAGPQWDGRPPRPFEIVIPQAQIDDLRQRLLQTRWPDEAPDGAWKLGTDQTYLRRLVRYWEQLFDWRKQEQLLNSLRQFKVSIGGIEVHFIHEAAEGPAPMPILLPHGWPGSFNDFHKLIPMLTHPTRFGGDAADSFTVVAPSLPGHGFSFSAGQPRFDLQGMADVLAVLMMQVLGYDRFAAHGPDWGAFIATRLAWRYAAHLTGIHITLLATPRSASPDTPASAEEARFQQQLAHWLKEETGYSAIMGTRPQTLAYALSDSPVGLAAWIVEKFHRWSDCDGDLDRHIGRDVLLTNIMIYWLTGSINASCWPYYARMHGPPIVPAGEKVTVPTGYAEHPREILTPPRSLAEGTYGNIQRWTRMPRGGHFPALEAPAALAEEIRAFFRPLRPGKSFRSFIK
jgi:pimeloyl-ACP methyl ester carboxylesterase